VIDKGSRDMTESSSSGPALPIGWTAAAAGEAARLRALSCHHRIEALRAARPFDPGDALRAHELLATARKRAANAEARRRTGVARLVAVKASSVGGYETLEQPPGWIADRLREHRIALSALYEQYFALGGEASLFDVDGHVHGVFNLPPAQQSVLEHALWELIELTVD
jgi:hypothetical protein